MAAHITNTCTMIQQPDMTHCKILSWLKNWKT